MPKILQGRLQQYMNCELSDVQPGFRKGKGSRDQIAKICWVIEKTRIPEIHPLLLYWLCQSLWLCESQQTVENSSRDRNTRPPYLPPEKSECRSKSNSYRLAPNWETSTSRLSPCFLTYMQSTSCEILGWMKRKLEGIKTARGNINNLSYADVTTLMAESDGRTKEPLDESEKGKWKCWLKIQYSEN